MKALILCVDRDDDLGVKGRVQTPVVGRRRCLEAALALGLADPEDSDTNALLAAVHLYDQESMALEGSADQVEVAAVAGHRSLGIRGDRKLAAEIDDVIALARPDQVILVSDGAEDEQVIPMLTSRVKVLHIHRSVVKQAPRLEGFYYVITRILDDPKQARRFVLPVAILMLFWGIGFLAGLQNYAWGATLAFLGAWLLLHAMQWDAPVARFLSDIGRGLRGGRLTWVALLAFLACLAAGAGLAWYAIRNNQVNPELPDHRIVVQLVGLQAFLPLLIIGLAILTLGNLVTAFLRDGRTRLRHWTALLGLLSLGILAITTLDILLDNLQGAPLRTALTPDRLFILAAGSTLAVGGAIIVRYVRAFRRDAPRATRVRPPS